MLGVLLQFTVAASASCLVSLEHASLPSWPSAFQAQGFTESASTKLLMIIQIWPRHIAATGVHLSVIRQNEPQNNNRGSIFGEAALKLTMCDMAHQSNKAGGVCFLPKATVRTCEAGVWHVAIALTTTSSSTAPMLSRYTVTSAALLLLSAIHGDDYFYD